MKVAAVICEYNPFHNGHKYQIELIKRDFDAVFCVMSGSFIERGDVAVFDKWTRTKAALSCGVDLILELPVRYSLSSANRFAKGAVKTVIGSGVADALVFGSEANDIEKLSEASDILLSEPPEISEKIKELLSDGISFPMAKQTAFSNLIEPDILTKPNNILATEYIMALKEEKSSVIPITHSRTAEHSGGFSEDGYASASHIRQKIKSGEDISDLCPFDYADCEIYDINKLTDIFKFLLITKGETLFADIPDAEAGLTNRFLKFSDLGSFEEIINASVTKRYTRSYLNRIALRAILGIIGGYREPEYLRVLGANAVGRTLLSEMKKRATLPIVTKVADFPKPLLEEDIRATDIASLCGNTKKGRDFLISPIMI
ncbi:MAG: nucleotidyltransferase family protein [Clostridia bacterium]|nr:nucleotidyltransferase family protein [Clostridia bacterium]